MIKTTVGRLDLPARTAGSRLHGNDKIDICRGLFAFLVVAAHGLEMTWSLHPGGSRPLHRPDVPVCSATGPGQGLYWVMGFFVISGYCIYLSAQRLIEAGRSSSRHIWSHA